MKNFLFSQKEPKTPTNNSFKIQIIKTRLGLKKYTHFWNNNLIF